MKKVVWESQHFDFDALTGHLDKDIDKEFDEFDYDDEGSKEPKLMHTPFGMFSIDDSMNPYRQFKFWLAHTNFNIDDSIAMLIEDTPGVEVLKILTRYRFLIAVGHLFNASEVKQSIQKAITNSSPEDSIENTSLRTKINNLRNSLIQKGDSWAIYVFPNGEITSFSTSDPNEYTEQLKLYKESKERSGGILIYE